MGGLQIALDYAPKTQVDFLRLEWQPELKFQGHIVSLSLAGD